MIEHRGGKKHSKHKGQSIDYIMNNLLETAYKLMEGDNYEKSLEIYKNILYSVSKEKEDIGIKHRAIKECFCLSEKYLPAKQILLSYKKSLLQKLKENNPPYINDLIEYAEICFLAKDDNEFLQEFENICKVHIKSAQAVYSIVEKILINNKRWDLCSMCIDDPLDHSAKLLEQYDELMRISKHHFNGKYDKKYNLDLCKKLHTLFWILKVSKRDTESQKVLNFIRKELSNRNVNCEE